MADDAVILFVYLVITNVKPSECSYYLSYSNSNSTASDKEATVAGIILGVLFAIGILTAGGVCIAIFCCKSKAAGSQLVSHGDRAPPSSTTITFVDNGSPPGRPSFSRHAQGPPPYQSLYPGSPPRLTTRQQALPSSPPPVYSET